MGNRKYIEKYSSLFLIISVGERFVWGRRQLVSEDASEPFLISYWLLTTELTDFRMETRILIFPQKRE